MSLAGDQIRRAPTAHSGVTLHVYSSPGNRVAPEGSFSDRHQGVLDSGDRPTSHPRRSTGATTPKGGQGSTGIPSPVRRLFTGLFRHWSPRRSLEGRRRTRNLLRSQKVRFVCPGNLEDTCPQDLLGTGVHLSEHRGLVQD